MATLLILSWLAAYLAGSIPFAVVVTRLMKLEDPRAYGSHNPGATNVLRGGNKKAALLTLLGDGAKGWAVVYGLRCLMPRLGATESLALPMSSISELDVLLAGAMVCVFLGHLYSVFLRFSGGKGVATALGVMLGLNPITGLLLIMVWLVVARLSRYSSVAALAAALSALPLYIGVAALQGVVQPAVAVAIALISILLIWRHRSNIKHLQEGTEVKIGQGR